MLSYNIYNYIFYIKYIFKLNKKILDIYLFLHNIILKNESI